MFGRKEMLSMTQGTPSPQLRRDVETLLFGAVFPANGTGRLHRIERPMDRAMYH